ncbi:Gpr1 family protein [Cyathus striatus]|nr:Gpr1 family protein [Cyathus striatus]
MSHHNHDIEKAEVQATSPYDALGRLHHPPSPTSIANPGTLGLFSFASTTLILSLINAQARGISHPNVVLGMAIFCGGLAQLLAGMWEFPRGNVFGGTGMSLSFVIFFFYSVSLHPGPWITELFFPEAELSGALGIYLITWAIVTFLLLIAALRKNVSFIALFSCLTITFILLGAGEFSGSAATAKAGGIVGVITALIAYYIGLSELLSAEDMAVFRLPLGIFPKRID